ncbi:MAG TPA: lipocalin family protein [Kiritimatiellia bacterium]|nr:lipocalin family protein [Kiritimatiellia bacterium]
MASGILVSLGCSTVKPPPTVEYVDLPRFMGDWYVVGGILTSFERDAYHAIENYQLDKKGNIPTTYTFRRGGFDGPLKTYRSKAFVHNKETFAEWRIQFIWPLKFPYLVIYLDEDYQATAISTDDKKYLWIMSRTPQMPERQYGEIMNLVTELGFDTNKIVSVPQPAQ